MKKPSRNTSLSTNPALWITSFNNTFILWPMAGRTNVSANTLTASRIHNEIEQRRSGVVSGESAGISLHPQANAEPTENGGMAAAATGEIVAKAGERGQR